VSSQPVKGQIPLTVTLIDSGTRHQ